MNFDINMLSTLMQMLGSQKPQTATATQQNEVPPNAHDNPRQGVKIQSVFAMQNGIGDRVDFDNAQNKKSAPPSPNPMTAMMEMFTGKNQNTNGDMMSGFMPMLMNMLNSKNAQVAKKETATSAKENEDKKAEKINENIVPAVNENNPQNKPFSQVKCRKSDIYEPILFAGYALISALNKLYVAKLRT